MEKRVAIEKGTKTAETRETKVLGGRLMRFLRLRDFAAHILNIGFWNAEECLHRSCEFLKCGLAFDWLRFHVFMLARRSATRKSFREILPIFWRSPTHGAWTRLRVAVKAVPSVFHHLGVRFPACSKGSIGEYVLMAHCDSMPHQFIWDSLTARPWWLMFGSRIVLVWLAGPSAFFENRFFVSDFLEQP